MEELTKFEEQIMLSVWKLQDKAYGLTIYNNIIEVTGKKLAIGGIYFPLERLVKRGYLKAEKGEPTKKRGGQSKKFYSLTSDGQRALVEAKKTQEVFWTDLPELNESE